MRTLTALLMMPLMILNALGGIIGGIWLGIVGQWWALGIGILSFITANFILAIVMIPGLAIGAPGLLLIERKKYLLALPFILLTQGYTYAVMTIWCIASLYTFMSRANEHTFLA